MLQAISHATACSLLIIADLACSIRVRYNGRMALTIIMYSVITAFYIAGALFIINWAMGRGNNELHG